MEDRSTEVPGDELPPGRGEKIERMELGEGDARMERIADYLRESLAKSDSLEANLGVANAELFLMASRMMQELTDILNRDPDEAMGNEQFIQGFDRLLRLDKQIDRFSHLLVKLRDPPES
jgi:hypothetical protein